MMLDGWPRPGVKSVRTWHVTRTRVRAHGWNAPRGVRMRPARQRPPSHRSTSEITIDVRQRRAVRPRPPGAPSATGSGSGRYGFFLVVRRGDRTSL